MTENLQDVMNAGNVITEYGQLFSGGGYLTFNPAPEIEAIFPMAERIRAGMRHGGHVGRRKIIVVEGWTEVTDPEATP